MNDLEKIKLILSKLSKVNAIFTAKFIVHQTKLPLKIVNYNLAIYIQQDLIKKFYALENPENIGEKIYFDQLSDIKFNHEYESKVTGKIFWIGSNLEIETLFKFVKEGDL